jgi:hypothetical protein
MRREPLDLDVVRASLTKEPNGNREGAMDGELEGDREMSMSTQMPAGRPAARNGATAPPTGLPPEQLHTWLEWVQDDLRRIESRLEYLEAARAQLREQERLLGELLHSSGPLR